MRIAEQGSNGGPQPGKLAVVQAERMPCSPILPAYSETYPPPIGGAPSHVYPAQLIGDGAVATATGVPYSKNDLMGGTCTMEVRSLVSKESDWEGVSSLMTLTLPIKCSKPLNI